MGLVDFICLAVLAPPVAPGIDVHFTWTPGEGYPPGTTYQLESNGVAVSGITVSDHVLHVPVRPGDVVDARVKAVPSPEAAAAGWKESQYATLRATYPAAQPDPCVVGVAR